MRTLPMIAAGMLVAQGCAEEGDDVEARVSYASGFFLVRRASTQCLPTRGITCSGFVASAVNSGTTRCADGSWSPACDVSVLDLSGTGLPTAQADVVARSITDSNDSPTVVVRGRLSLVDGHATLSASEAWRAPVSAEVRGAFHLVSTVGSGCAYLPCASVQDQRVNAALEPEAIAGVDLTDLSGVDDITRDLALGDAASDTGLLVAGTQSFSDGRRVLRAGQVFVRVRPSLAPGLCAQELRAALDVATGRLVYPSQTDAPFRALSHADVSSMPAADQFNSVVGMTVGTAVRLEAFDTFMQPLTSTRDEPSEQLRVARFRMLERTLREHLSNLTVYRVGTVDVRVFVLGLSACGELAGVETSALER